MDKVIQFPQAEQEGLQFHRSEQAVDTLKTLIDFIERLPLTADQRDILVSLANETLSKCENGAFYNGFGIGAFYLMAQNQDIWDV